MGEQDGVKSMAENQGMQEPRTALRKLKTSWAGWAFLAILAGTAGYLLLHNQWQPGYARRWLVFYSMAAAFLLWELWRGLKDNRPSSTANLSPVLGAANHLTLLRGLWVAILAGFLFSPWPDRWLSWAPGSLYFLVTFSDLFDGYLARVTGHTTRLGQKLDLWVDGLGVLAASVLLVQYGQAPTWYLLVAAARYLFIAWTRLLRRLGKPVYDLPASLYRRPLAGIQMGFLVVVLLPVFSPPATTVAALVFAVPFLAGFLRDGLAVGGLINPGSLAVSPRFRWGLVGLRLVVAVSAIWGLLPRLLVFSDLPEPLSTLVLLESLVALMLIAGLAGRAAAVLGLCLLGFNQVFASLSPIQILLVAGYTAIVFAGTGAWSVWKPEDYLLFRHFGTRRPSSGAASPGGAL